MTAQVIRLIVSRADEGFDESKVTRDEHGKFTSSGGGSFTDKSGQKLEARGENKAPKSVSNHKAGRAAFHAKRAMDALAKGDLKKAEEALGKIDKNIKEGQKAATTADEKKLLQVAQAMRAHVSAKLDQAKGGKPAEKPLSSKPGASEKSFYDSIKAENKAASVGDKLAMKAMAEKTGQGLLDEAKKWEATGDAAYEAGKIDTAIDNYQKAAMYAEMAKNATANPDKDSQVFAKAAKMEKALKDAVKHGKEEAKGKAAKSDADQLSDAKKKADDLLYEISAAQTKLNMIKDSAPEDVVAFEQQVVSELKAQWDKADKAYTKLYNDQLDAKLKSTTQNTTPKNVGSDKGIPPLSKQDPSLPNGVMSFAQLEEERAEFKNAQTSQERESTVKYTGGYYDHVNSALRGINGAALTPADKRHVKNIDSALEKAPAKEDMMVFRGVGKGPWDDLEPGDSFIDKGYASTSVSRERAFGGSTIFTIHVPKGMPAAPVTGHHDHEKEILLPRNNEYEVVSIEYVNGKKHMHLRAKRL